MEWTADVSAGDWIRDRLDANGPGWAATMHCVVPRGFPAYARILHRVLDGDDDGAGGSPREEGHLDAARVAATAEHLAAHTSTPDDVFVAVWEGWGGLLGFFGEHPAGVVLTPASDDDPAVLAHHRAMLERSIHDPFNNVFRKPVWQAGLLNDDVSKGPRLQLPNRGHVLFRGSISQLTDPRWAARVPWAEANPDWTASPSLVWPADRSWVLVTEVDYTSTIVAGSAELVRTLCADPAVAAEPLREGADVSGDADEVNR